MTTLDDFRRAIERAGLTAPETIIPDGKLHRFASNGNREDEAGWYTIFPDGVPAGVFGCWRSGVKQTWCSKSDRQLTKAERTEYRGRLDQARQLREAEERRRQAEAAGRAQTLWEQSFPAPADHPEPEKGSGVFSDGNISRCVAFLTHVSTVPSPTRPV